MLQRIISSALLLVFSFLLNAQVTKTLTGMVYEDQMIKTVFTSPQGNIKVYLPDDMAAGDVISGTVVAEPSGKNEKEKKKNLGELLNYSLNFGSEKFPVTAAPGNFSFTLPHPDRQMTLPMELFHVSGYKAAELKFPVIPSAPVYLPVTDPVITAAGNVIVKGQPLALSSDGTFSSSPVFTITDATGKTVEVKPICSSSHSAVVQIPPAVKTGNITVASAMNNKPVQCKIRLIDIMVSASNTNLRKGQTAVLEAYIDPKITDKDSAEAMQIPVMSLDLRNLDPGNVSIESGNLQRISLPQGKATQAASWAIQRTLTGITAGNFSIAVTLHNDFSICNDPFHPQKEVLTTPEDFNAWAAALKKDLEAYAGKQGTDETGRAASANAERAVNNMPTCYDKNKLDECKALADALLRPLNIPKAAAALWLSGLEAYKAASKAIPNELDGKPGLIAWDVIKNGLDIITRMGAQLKDQELQNGATNAKKLIDNIQKAGETKEQLQLLKNKLDELNKKADGKTGSNPYNSFYSYTFSDLMVSGYSISASGNRPTEKIELKYQRIHPVTDLVGFLDPLRKVLFVVAAYKDQLLGMLNGKLQPGGKYLIQSQTAGRKPVSYAVSVVNANPLQLFDISNEVNKTLLYELNEVDSSKRIVSGKDEFINFDAEFKDKNGTTYRFYKNAECKLAMEARSDGKCEADSDYKPEAKEGEPRFVPNGKYVKYDFLEQWQCVKGAEICIEGIYVMVIKYIYQDPGCKKLIDVQKTYSINCH